jgi:uroporphyrinogen decarboxylase
LLYTNPQFAHRLLQMITNATIEYLKMQINAGANLVQIFDSWAGILSPAHYSTFSLPYIAQICDAISEVPVTVFAKGAFFALPEMKNLNCETIGLDWNMTPSEARAIFGNSKTLQGNLDPCQLYGSFDQIRKATQEMLSSFGEQRHIANLGHGVYPDTDPDKVKCFIDTVKEYKYKHL